MIIVCHSLLKNTKILAITLYPFIVLKHRKSQNDLFLLNHEKIHLRQQLEMLVLPFYILYLIEFYVRLFRSRDKQKAYRNISFEREAYEHEGDLEYLENRRFWSFFKYLNHA